MTSQDQIAAFIAKNGVTVCESTGSHKDNARSLRQLRAKQEQEISGDGVIDAEDEDLDAERESEQMREHFGAHRAAGVSREVAWDNWDSRA